MRHNSFGGVMQYREFGRTGIKISEIGFGTWGMGGTWWGGTMDKSAEEALSLSLDLGVNFFDTAYVYGDGHSEQLIGEAVRKCRDKIYIATKVPPKDWQWPAKERSDPGENFPAGW